MRDLYYVILLGGALGTFAENAFAIVKAFFRHVKIEIIFYRSVFPPDVAYEQNSADFAHFGIGKSEHGAGAENSVFIAGINAR